MHHTNPSSSPYPAEDKPEPSHQPGGPPQPLTACPCPPSLPPTSTLQPQWPPSCVFDVPAAELRRCLRSPPRVATSPSIPTHCPHPLQPLLSHQLLSEAFLDHDQDFKSNSPSSQQLGPALFWEFNFLHSTCHRHLTNSLLHLLFIFCFLPL